MKHVFFLLFLILFSLPSAVKAQKVEFKVKGVEIATDYQTALRLLGKPLSNRRGGTNPCGYKKRVVRYPGLTLTFDQPDAEKSIVVRIEVTSPKWRVVPGFSVGTRLKDVKARHGKPHVESVRPNVLTYFDGDGGVTLHFRKGTIVKAIRDLNLC